MRLTNLPEGMNEIALELFLEKYHGGPFSTDPEITIDSDAREAKIAFGDVNGQYGILTNSKNKKWKKIIHSLMTHDYPVRSWYDCEMESVET